MSMVGEQYDILKIYIDNYLKINSDKIEVRILGADHKEKPFTGDDLPIDTIFNSRDHDYSTTNTIAKIIEERS